jgi:translocation and assembly module TamB
LEGKPEIRSLDLQVLAQDYNLGKLPIQNLPGNIKLLGRVDFRGRVTGTLTALNAAGNLRTRNLRLNQLAFDPVMAGAVNFRTNQRTVLQLAGTQDRIALDLGPNFRPNAFRVQRGEAIAVGESQGDLLRVQVRQFPLIALNLRPLPDSGLGLVSGLAGGNFIYNWSNQKLDGNLLVTRPSWGGVTGDRFVADVNFAQGVASIQNGKLVKGQSLYLVNARVGTNQTYSGQIVTTTGRIQDLVPLIRATNPDLLKRSAPVYAKASVVQPQPVGDPNAPLLDQIKRLELIDAQIAQRRQLEAETATLPSLEELEGGFRGQVDFSGSVRAGLQAGFDVQGQQIRWGSYTVDQAIAKGNFANGTLNINPARIDVKDGYATFVGSVGGQRQTGRLVAQNLPIAGLQKFVGLSNLDITGALNGTATLSGNQTNPQASGSFNLVGATLNKKPLQNASATLNYQNARLVFNGSALIDSKEPILVTGNLPYVLPFAQQKAPSEDIALDLQVKNDGLSVVNLFTDQIAWVDGQGAVNLQVRGTLKQPKVVGLVSLQNATLNAAVSNEPLTGVTGNLRFDRDRLQVEGLSGKFSAGQIVASGIIPISEPLAGDDPARESPLTVNLRQLSLNLRELYQGGASGDLTLTGTVLKPELGGKLILSQGQVFLTDIGDDAPKTVEQSLNMGFRRRSVLEPSVLLASSADSSGSDTSQPGAIAQAGSDAAQKNQSPFEPLRFNQLQVILGDNLRIRRRQVPVLNFVAFGDITVNGTIDDIQPQGRVEFRRGQVNIYTSLLRLDTSKPNYAEFIPSQGLDPTLNVNLITTVTEVYGASFNRLDEGQVTPAGTLGSLTPVRVTARITGRASELETDFMDRVELASSPGRSQQEIFALLGGGTGRAGAEDLSLAVANIAGSAFLNNFQSIINDALGDRVQFRLFPALLPAQGRDASILSNSILGLGAELGFAITDRLSISALQVLTDSSEPTRFNIGYQVNDQIRLSTSVDINGQAVGLIEYRWRF